MKNLGCINGKVHILHHVTPETDVLPKTVSTGLKFHEGVGLVMLTPEEALDLADVITYAATDNLAMLPQCLTFKSAEDGCTCE